MSPYSTPMSHRKRLALILGPYIGLVLVMSLGFYVIERSQNHACNQRATDRNVLRQVVDVATTPGRSSDDLTKINGFDELDPQTRTYMRNLSIAVSSVPPPGKQTLHDQLLALLPPINC